MQIKKAAGVMLVLALMVGLFAPGAKAQNVVRRAYSFQNIKDKILQNKRVPFSVNEQYLGQKSKNSLAALIQKKIKENPDTTTYYNAAIIYAAIGTILPTGALFYSPKEAANVKKYATAVLNKEPANWHMYYVRAAILIRSHQLNVWECLSLKEAYRETLLKQEGAIREALPDFEKVGELHPAAAPWDFMAEMYEALNKKEKAERCRKNGKSYSQNYQFVLEKEHEAVRRELQKLFA